MVNNKCSVVFYIELQSQNNTYSFVGCDTTLYNKITVLCTVSPSSLQALITTWWRVLAKSKVPVYAKTNTCKQHLAEEDDFICLI